jgi:hypothetical protein
MLFHLEGSSETAQRGDVVGQANGSSNEDPLSDSSSGFKQTMDMNTGNYPQCSGNDRHKSPRTGCVNETRHINKVNQHAAKSNSVQYPQQRGFENNKILVNVAGSHGDSHSSGDANNSTSATMFVPSCSNLRRSGKSHARVEIDCCGHPNAPKKPKRLLYLAFALASLGIGSICIAIIGWLSHFQNGNSTSGQRQWMMTWLVYGIVLGPLYAAWPHAVTNKLTDAEGRFIFQSQPIYIGLLIVVSNVIYLGCFCFPAIIGFGLIGRMLREYGTCIRIN